MGDWLPSEPKWWDTVKALGKSPIDFVLGIVWAALASMFVDGGKFVIGIVSTAFDIVVDVFDLVRTTLVSVFGPIGVALLGLPRMLVGLVAFVEQTAGPAAPFILVPAGVLLALAAWRVLEATVTILGSRA